MPPASFTGHNVPAWNGTVKEAATEPMRSALLWGTACRRGGVVWLHVPTRHLNRDASRQPRGHAHDLRTRVRIDLQCTGCLVSPCVPVWVLAMGRSSFGVGGSGPAVSRAQRGSGMPMRGSPAQVGGTAELAHNVVSVHFSAHRAVHALHTHTVCRLASVHPHAVHAQTGPSRPAPVQVVPHAGHRAGGRRCQPWQVSVQAGVPSGWRRAVAGRRGRAGGGMGSTVRRARTDVR